MEFKINSDELDSLYGLPHAHQLIYLRGIRPYMDFKTGVTGLKVRRISRQSLTEQLYEEPGPGRKVKAYSKDQISRAIRGLARAGLVAIQSEGKRLIVECLLASKDNCVQNKAASKSPHETASLDYVKSPAISVRCEKNSLKAAISKNAEAATPPVSGIYYVFLQTAFEQFWITYPEKRGRGKAWQAFLNLQPDELLTKVILQRLQQQVHHWQQQQKHGEWVPQWKYPANWLQQRCWEDELTPVSTTDKHKEKAYGLCTEPVNTSESIRGEHKHKHSSQRKSKRNPIDILWESCKGSVEVIEQADNTMHTNEGNHDISNSTEKNEDIIHIDQYRIGKSAD